VRRQRRTKDGNTVSGHYTCAPDRINLPTYKSVSQFHGTNYCDGVDARKRYCRYYWQRRILESALRAYSEYIYFARVIRLRDPQISPCLPDIFRNCEICKLIAE